MRAGVTDVAFDALGGVDQPADVLLLIVLSI
jgi:hypothetical protein